MWLFKKREKKEKPSWQRVAIKELKSFRKMGEKFNYLGVEMTVCGHYKFDPYFGYTPSLRVDYVNKKGEIKSISFAYQELETLKKENN